MTDRKLNINIPHETLDAVSHEILIRKWWYTYKQALRQEVNGYLYWKELNELTAECERHGIVKKGRPMPRDGAEDLARSVDEFRAPPPF